MNRAPLLLVLMFWPGLGAHARAQTASPTSCESAEQLGYTIARITTVGVPSNIELSVRTGDPFSAEALNKMKDEIAALFDEEEDGAYRFSYRAVTVSCTFADPRKSTIDVEVRADNVAIPEGDSAGSVIDEANADRLDTLRDLSSVGFKWDRDTRLGEVLGLVVHGRSSREGSPFNVVLDGWKAADNPFYSIAMSSALTTYLNARGLHTLGDSRFWAETLPFAEGALSSKGFRLGSGWEWQSGRADLRVRAAYRLSWVSFDGPLESERTHVRNAIELSTGQEFLVHGGFARLGGWLDAGGGTRFGGFTRVYQDIAFPDGISSNVDVTLMVGRAPRSVELDRRFVGGNVLEPFLGDKNLTPEEFTWTGPILRGHGVSDFYVPRHLYASDDGAAYTGFSLTWGVPGWRKPVIGAIDVSQREVVSEAVQKAYDLAVVSLIQENVRRGASGDTAKRRSEREARELREALHNLMRHAHRIVVSPLVTVDAGWLTDHGFERHALDVGAGVRIQRPGISIEILNTRSAHDSLAEYPRASRWLVRLSMRGAFKFS